MFIVRTSTMHDSWTGHVGPPALFF